MSTVTSLYDASTHLVELQAAAADSGDRPFFVIDGTAVTYAEAFAQVLRCAEGLRRAGVAAGDRVLIMTPNRPESVVVWLAANVIGAIDAPLSHETRGALLDYFVRDLEPVAVVGTQECLLRISDSSAYRPRFSVLLDGGAGRPSVLGDDVVQLAFDDLVADEPGVDLAFPDADTTATIIYTSGTTGPSKGVMLSHGYWAEIARTHLALVPFVPHEVVYCAQPLCHIDPRSLLMDVMFVRGSVVLPSRFSASSFWSDIEAHDADKFVYVGTMLHLIFKQPDRESGRSMRPRIGMGAAAPESLYRAIEARFNVRLYEGYGMTEVPVMAHHTGDAGGPGHIGPPIDMVELRLVDDSGEDVPDGGVGECVIRPRTRYHMMQGYWRKPEAMVEATRGLWFHTGDNLRRNADGSLAYIGRKKDAIRRRGENVSAWEVEEAANRHPAVREAAAIGVPSELGEEDVALLIVLVDPDGPLDAAELRSFVAADLPRFAVPRYIEIVESLPKTPSERIAKGVVRQRGITTAAYDAEAAAE